MKHVTQSVGSLFLPPASGEQSPNNEPAERGRRAVTPGCRNGQARLADVIDAYMSAYSGRDTSRAQRLEFWRSAFGQRTLDDLSDDDVFDGIERLGARRGRYFAGKDADGAPILKAKSKPLAAATVNRYQAALSSVLTWTVRSRIAPRGWQNPCRVVALRAERNEIVRFLSDTERNSLLAACRASSWTMLYPLVLLALTTGARRGELEALAWGDIDLERAEASVRRSKNGDKKILPLVPAVVEALRPHERPRSELVFASTRRPDRAFNFTPAWQAALKEAGVKAFRFHDLRHSCASYLAQAGAPLLQIAEVLGHRQLSVTRRYSHLTTQNKAELVHKVLGAIR